CRNAAGGTRAVIKPALLLVSTQLHPPLRSSAQRPTLSPLSEATTPKKGAEPRTRSTETSHLCDQGRAVWGSTRSRFRFSASSNPPARLARMSIDCDPLLSFTLRHGRTDVHSS
ncbi:hypothetical protein HPB47_004954, partial [Ixodes persulcatus]